ncbi:DNA polymerase IV [Legionella micdadei]|uniref:DNA polymerase IV n=1 Tax=Legionella micdadei TaxID=451 RepID=A0A098GBG0_LEGMI|nr:DNA polymerase IV [Legionella micdadei]ARG98492.1 DNA polymerase IV [Legionella micdadei]ARH01235.1 DNA polymerase IV [Legionella micdadei]KTD30298.1 DNA polymerase IV [Legionella micdadei]NSL18428.1 DNA polymerase IV [Legionella micdadei]CEG59819.1 DNA polymerase IV [Legionella micdadei]
MAKVRKIIHIDMDCFYAAIEIRDNPTLVNKPVAVGGASDRRGVLCTCNYIARQYGVRSAMPTVIARRLCPDLLVLPVNMAKYRQVSQVINAIFKEFTDLVEPLSLDEAFLDVTDCTQYRGSATWIAEAIRLKIWQAEELTASAGVAPNKFLAKIASAWKKPNGLFVIRPEDVTLFVNQLPVAELFGVGKVTAAKLRNMNIMTCADLLEIPLRELIQHFGKLGQHLYNQCRGIDDRPVQPNRVRKSLSVEITLSEDISDSAQAREIIDGLYRKLLKRINDLACDFLIKNQYIKIKFDDFQLMTAEIKNNQADLQAFYDLFNKIYKEQKAIRLIGLGVHFHLDEKYNGFIQQSLF